jgi:hypothetical protein
MVFTSTDECWLRRYYLRSTVFFTEEIACDIIQYKANLENTRVYHAL